MSAPEWLETALADDDFPRAMRAAARLAGLPADELAPHLPALAGALAEADPAARRRAALVHAVLGPAAAANLPALLAALDSPAWTVREAVAQALGRLGGASAALAGRALFDSSEAVRRACRQALADNADPQTLRSLRDGSSHPHAWVRVRALQALAALTPAADHVDALAAALDDSHFRARRVACELLGQAGPAASVALARLARSRFDGEARVARAAASALGRLGPTLPPPLARLVAVLAACDRPADALRRLLDAVPEEDVLGEFGAVCRRRQRWHCSHRGQEAPPPQGTVAAQLDATLAAAGKPDAEAAWLVGWLAAELLARYRPPAGP